MVWTSAKCVQEPISSKQESWHSGLKVLGDMAVVIYKQWVLFLRATVVVNPINSGKSLQLTH